MLPGPMKNGLLPVQQTEYAQTFWELPAVDKGEIFVAVLVLIPVIELGTPADGPPVEVQVCISDHPFFSGVFKV